MKLKIVSTSVSGRDCKVWLDDYEVPMDSIKSVEVVFDRNDINNAVISFLPSGIEIDAETFAALEATLVEQSVNGPHHGNME